MATWGDTKTTSTGGNISMKLKAGYDNVSHSGNTVYAKIYGAMTMAGSTWSKNQFGIWIEAGGTKYVVKNSGTQSSSGTWYEASKDCSWDVGTVAGGTKSVSVGFGWNAWNASQGNTASVSFSYPAASLWNDINAWNPSQTSQGGLIFNLSTSDGSSWTNLTNEPENFTKPYGTTATISNIRSNVTGAHYSGNSVTGSASSTISWTFNTANYSVEIYTAWDTYTISYNANGGTGAPGAQTKTYGTNLTLSSTKPTRANSTATGYTVTFDANGGSVSPTSKSATDTISYSFNNWKDTGGTTYAAGGTYTKNQADTLTAQWNTSTTKGSVATPTATRSNGTSTRTVNFNANGGSSTKTSQNSTATVTYTANGWYTATSGGTKRCNNGASYTPTASEKVYQQWSSSTGTFSAVTMPTTTQCTRSGYKLLGFSTSDTATTATYAPGASYTPTATTTTLYAVWQLDQAAVWVKVNGTWVKGKVWYKNSSGTWVKCQKFYTKSGGVWVENKTTL